MKLLKTITVKPKVIIEIWEADDGTVILGGIGWIEYWDWESREETEWKPDKSQIMTIEDSLKKIDRKQKAKKEEK